jgi:cell division protein FtsZ
MIHFDLPKDQSSIIKVIGVGGGGSNAVNHMFEQNIEGVDFIICNTDAQAIATSLVPNKVQLGPHLTQGLGAGANPAIGKQATEESLEEIKRILEVNTKMAFITAGMGGGTGTGGAPIIASICKQLGILTVGIVTTPFTYEGKKRVAQAEEGIMLLKEHVDTLLVISNDKLRHQFGNLKMKEAFNKADGILATAAKCITDVINSTGQINVDFADVCTVMKNGGVAILGSAMASGENRAHLAVENALTSPLLNDNDIRGAKWILININSAEGDHEFTMDEVEIIQSYILAQAGEETDVILGLGYDNTLGNEISITLIATGFEHKDPFAKKNTAASQQAAADAEKIVMHLDMQNNTTANTTPAPKVEVPTPVENVTTQFITTPTIADVIEDKYMPKLVEEKTEQIELPIAAVDTTPDYFAITPTEVSTPTIVFDLGSTTTTNEVPTTQPAQTVVNHTNNPVMGSNGFLTKPTQIYVDRNTATTHVQAQAPTQVPVQAPVQQQPAAALPKDEMQLVEKTTTNTTPIVTPVSNVNLENQLQDETEQLRMRAAERIAKLRNLSFNINAADPNNEFEEVPAYLRRNMDMHNQIADVETFYSNYTVSSNDKNQADLNSLNNFLDGKKPD